MDKQELDRQYSPSQWSKRGNPEQVIENFYQVTSSRTCEVQSEFVVERNVRYGSKQNSLVDIYSSHSLSKESPVLVYIHGGFWQEGNKECYGFFKPFCQKGIRVMIPGYDLAPQVTLGEIVEEMKHFLSFLITYSTNNNVNEVWLCGHSAGAQLALSMFQDLTPETDCGLISGIILISGIYDLKPVIHTYNNIKLQLTEEEAEMFSPMAWLKDGYVKHIKDLTLLVCVGEDESPAFIQQSTDFYKMLEKIGVKVKWMSLEGCDHFNIVTDLYLQHFKLTSTILNLINVN